MSTGWTKQNTEDTDWSLWGNFLYIVDHADFYLRDYDEYYIVLDTRSTWGEQSVGSASWEKTGVSTGTSWEDSTPITGTSWTKITI